MTDDEFKRRRAARALRERKGLIDTIAMPGIPVDADPPQLRRSVPSAERVMSMAENELLEMLRPKNPFFDEIVEAWPQIGKDIPAWPGRADEGKIFLYVKTSAQNYAVRSMLRKIRSRLKILPHAPSKISLHVEIRG